MLAGEDGEAVIAVAALLRRLEDLQELLEAEDGLAQTVIAFALAFTSDD